MLCTLQRRVLTVLVLWSFVSWADAVHMDSFSQRPKENSSAILNQPKQKLEAVETRHQTEGKKMSTTNNTSAKPKKSVSQLQLEVKELNRMQKQLNLEIVKGVDNTKKKKLLQHIKTQIHLRQTQVDKQQQHHQQQHQQQHSGLHQLIKPSQQNQKRLKHVHHQSAGNQQTIQQKIHTVEPFQPVNKPKHASEIQSSPQTHNQQTQNVHFRQQHQPKLQNQQQEQLQQQSQNDAYNLQEGNNVYMPISNSLKQVPVENNNTVQVHKNTQTQYQNLAVLNNNLQRQQQYQVQQMLPQIVMQQRPVQSSVNKVNPIAIHPGQLNLIRQPALSMNQAVIQPGTQQILVPLNALPLNRRMPSQVLSNERIIFVETVRDQNGQKTPSPTQQTTTIQPSPMATTPPPTTTITTTAAATTFEETTMPTPPTTYSYMDETTPADANTFKKEYYKGEVKRQKLEIRKLQLEIRALQRNEFERMIPRGGGGGENEDAPPRPRLRFRARGMPFPFF